MSTGNLRVGGEAPFYREKGPPFENALIVTYYHDSISDAFFFLGKNDSESVRIVNYYHGSTLPRFSAR